MKIIIKLLIILSPLIIIMGLLWRIFGTMYLPPCTQTDIYEVSQWSECTKEGVQYRNISRIVPDFCRLPDDGTIKEPEYVQSCEYIYFDDRKTVKLLQDYETIFDLSGNTSASNNNLLLSIKGQIKNASLSITGRTQVLGWNIIKIPDNYGFYLHIDSDSIPRVIWTSRIGPNLVVNNVPGIFKGLDTPKTLTFDLSDIQLAKSSKEGDGFIKKDFVEILNNYSGKSVDMTLFMGAGGNSLWEADLKKRIYAVIESAFIEYECETDSVCEIVAKIK